MFADPCLYVWRCLRSIFLRCLLRPIVIQKIQYFSSVLEVSSCLAHLAILLIMVFVECSSNVLFVLPSCLI